MTDSLNDHSARPDPARSWQLRMLALMLLLEALALAVVTATLVLEIVSGASAVLASALALTLVTGIMAAGVLAIAVGAWRAQPWIRGAATTVQILLAAVALGAFQGAFARADIGWLLLAPAIITLLLIFSPSVVAATARPDR